MEQMETLQNWKLNISSFYPIGLTHYGNDKAALVIVWSYNSLCTKKFRSFSNAIDNNLPPDREHCTNIQQITESSILKIITGTLESVILTSNGQLMYFETAKIVKKVDYVENIKCICAAASQGFVILFLTADGGIMIMVHPDSFPCQPELLRSYDVSFERNFCQTTWNDAQFNIVSFRANPAQPTFFNRLRKCPDEQYTVNDSFVFFSINNTFLALIVNGDSDEDYQYHQIQTHSSNIRGIHASRDLSAIYLLLESGVIDVIYSCEILGVIRTSSLFFVYDVGPYDICDDIFVYSDGFRIVLGRIEYCSVTKTFKNHHKVIPLSGIVALTIVKMNRKVICLSENRIFYKISYSDDDLTANKPDTKQFIPVERFIANAERETIDIAELVAYYDSIKDETVLQNKTFEAIALRYNFKNDKSIFRFPLNAILKVYRTLPDLPPTAVYPTMMCFDKSSYFLHIQIQPHRFGEVFTSNIWSLTIQCQSHCSVVSKVIRLFNENFKEPLDVLMILKIRKDETAPTKVNINLSTSVTIGEDRLCLTFPVRADDIDFKDAIQVSNKIPSSNMPSNHRNASQQINKTSQSSIIYHLHLPKTISLYDLVQVIDPKAQLINENSCYLNLFSSYLELNADTPSNQLHLKSHESAIMFHVKKMLVEHLRTAFNLTVERQPEAIAQKYENALIRVQDISGSELPIVEKINRISRCLGELRFLRFSER